MPTNITIVNNTEGESLSIAGNAYRILISGQQTGGAYAVIDMLVPPGGGPGPHAHKDIQEMFYVAEGEVEFKTEAGKHTATKGALVNIPLGGAVHCFKNTSSQPARLLCTVVPAGLDDFFKEISKLAAPGAAPTEEQKARLTAIAEKYGQELYPPDYLG